MGPREIAGGMLRTSSNYWNFQIIKCNQSEVGDNGVVGRYGMDLRRSPSKAEIISVKSLSEQVRANGFLLQAY